MPHQCTTCGHTFEDGSKEMLGGCPDCGGNTFQFHPPGTDPPSDPPADSEPPEREEPTGASAVGRAATRVRDFVSSDSSPEPDATLDSSAGDPGPPPEEFPDAPDERPARTAASADETDEGNEAATTDAAPADPAGDSAGGQADAPEEQADTPEEQADTPEPHGTPGADGVDVVETGSDGPSRPRDDRPPTDSRPEQPADGSRTADRTRSRGPSTGSLDRSSSPDPNAPWPTEDDPSGSGGNTDGSSPAGSSDDIIDADAREAERAIGDAEGADDRAGGPERQADDSAPAREPGSPAASGGAAPGTSGRSDPATDDRSPGVTDDPPDDADPADEGGLAAAENAPDGAGQVVSEPSGDQPDLADLREQLNEQFESIKILEPGQYELNLMELYDREEYIIALQENGRYVIQVPENWMGDRPGEE